MATTTKKDQLNNANANELASYLQEFQLGDFLRSLPVPRRRQVPAVDSYSLSTLTVVKLPDDAKAATVIRATGLTGTVTGEFAAQAFGATPTTGQVAVTPSGDIAFLGTDAVTLADVTYQPERGDVYEAVLPVVSNAISLTGTPAEGRAVLLMEAESLAGTSVGKKVVQTPSGSAASAASARLDLAKANVKFASGEATSARVKLLLTSKVDLDAKFRDTANY
jgi:hypothetical protein